MSKEKKTTPHGGGHLTSNTPRRADIEGLPTIGRSFGQRVEPHVSFEFFPPRTPKGWTQLEKVAARLSEFRPDFVSVTFGAGGSAKERTFQVSQDLNKGLGLDVVPHMSCLGLTRGQLEQHIENYRKAGFNKLLALRGDVPEGLSSPEEALARGGFRYANELVSFIKELGGFHIFVACYPEGHPEAPTMQVDIDNFIRKVDAGADVAVTQYFFNNAAYFHFVKELRRRGCEIPIVVGLMPVAPYEQVLRFSQKCGADIPLWIRKRMEGYQDDPESQLEFGVEVAVQQAEELFKSGAPGIHFYTLNRSDVTLRVCEHLFRRHVDLGLSWDAAAHG